MTSIRVPSPRDTFEVEYEVKLFSNVPKEDVMRYENGFLKNFLEYIKSDETLSHFHIRLVCECDNIAKVIDSVKPIDLLELEEIVDSITNARNLETASRCDADFHKRLFAITGEIGFFKWWLMQAENLNNFLANLWNSIGYKTDLYNELVILHNQIFQSIKYKNKDEALHAMQQHFALVFYQLLNTMYRIPQNSNNEKKE